MNQITEKEFSVDIQSENLVVVDFWAEWCAPCRMLKPVLDELSEEYGEDVKIVGLDVDTFPNVSATQSIRGIPTIGFYKKGIMIDRIVGAVPKSKIKEKIEALRQ